MKVQLIRSDGKTIDIFDFNNLNEAREAMHSQWDVITNYNNFSPEFGNVNYIKPYAALAFGKDGPVAWRIQENFDAR